MRVLYDGAIFSLQRAGGINRYAAQLIAHLPPSVRAILLTEGLADGNIPNCAVVTLPVGSRPHWSRPLRSVHRWRQRRALAQRESSIAADVFHPTYYTLLSPAWPPRRVPVVLTVYDLIHELFPALLDPYGEVAAIKRQAIERADALICPSQSARRDLTEIYGVPPSKVSVIPLASGLTFPRVDRPEVAPGGTTAALDRPYFLYVGSRAPYKNFDRAVQALKLVAGQRPDVRFAVVGPPFGTRQRRRLRQLGIERHMVPCGQVDDDRLAQLYRGSVALVYPSLYEGFGIPPLEAMTCGTAVICSTAASLPEVVGDAAMVFDPYDTEYLAALMMHVLDSPTTRRQLIERGYRRAEQFRWNYTARQTLAVYESVAGAASGATTPTVPLAQAA